MAAGDSTLDAFIDHWSRAEASERANAQPFLLGLAQVLGLPLPSNTHADGYSFEFPVRIPTGPGEHTTGFLDLYRRGSFVLEAKQFVAPTAEPTDLQLALGPADRKKSGPVRGSHSWDDAMWKARGQAERYARHLPADEPPAPFLLVVDVGHSLEVYADFTQAGRAYQAFPDPRSFRLRLEDLRDAHVRERLRRIWLDPLSLDPAKVSAEVTREIAGYLAVLATSLEEAGHAPRLVAEFLTRCLFCMFAEDVGLLPKDGFRGLLESLRPSPEGFVPKLRQLFAELQTGTDFSVILNRKLLRFNGGLFADASVLPVNGTQLGILIQAAAMQWKDVEPAIFGTLLERALDPAERHQLGAHYTPRAYVERLVLPTVIEPLRAEWQAVRAAALVHAQKGDLKGARAEITRFHGQLCEVTVLDPACGSGNFLYVTLEHLKRLEGEVLDTAAGFGENLLLDLATHSVDPHQFLGLELNPRAASLAELVLWIGYLQWHFRTRGQTLPAEPVLKKFRNIECRDAVLAWDGDPVPVTWEMAAANPDLPGLPDEVRHQLRSRRGDEAEGPQPPVRTDPGVKPPPPHVGGYQGVITVWDRRSMKTDLVTGRDVPDETKRVPLLTYPNARSAAWPKADYIVGNPPFLGTKRMRDALGDGYVAALREVYSDTVEDNADFVMYWWEKAAEVARSGSIRRFGFITTNSLRQTFNRRVIANHVGPGAKWSGSANPSTLENVLPFLSLVFAIPDHPWVDSAEGAAVRIAMTVSAVGEHDGELRIVTAEEPLDDGSAKVSFVVHNGRIATDLSVGADVSSVNALEANEGICGLGVALHGAGFILDPIAAENARKEGASVIKPYLGGSDLVRERRERYLIDFSFMSEEEARRANPRAFQHVIDHVRPERIVNRRDAIRRLWWRYGWERPEIRKAMVGLSRYIGTTETAKHRAFQFIDGSILPDHMIIVIASDDAFHLGVLSSRIHVVFSLAAGGRLGVGNDPRYNKTRCFDPFPFPVCDEVAKARIRALGEELDAHRKRVQAQHPGLSLTALYNVLEKLRSEAVPPVGRDSVEPTSKCSEASPASILPGGATPETRAARALAPRRGKLGSTESRPTGDAGLLTPKERLIHDQGLVSVLRQLHDELDAAVAAAYGWVRAGRPETDLTDAEILTRLVALNAERAAEESAGTIRWLRPEYQNRQPVAGSRKEQGALALPAGALAKPKQSAAKTKKTAWPKPLADRVRAVEHALQAAGKPVTAAALAKQFTRAQPDDLAEILETLVSLGRAHREGDRFTL